MPHLNLPADVSGVFRKSKLLLDRICGIAGAPANGLVGNGSSGSAATEVVPPRGSGLFAECPCAFRCSVDIENRMAGSNTIEFFKRITNPPNVVMPYRRGISRTSLPKGLPSYDASSFLPSLELP